jgi:hypothetical protein
VGGRRNALLHENGRQLVQVDKAKLVPGVCSVMLRDVPVASFQLRTDFRVSGSALTLTHAAHEPAEVSSQLFCCIFVNDDAMCLQPAVDHFVDALLVANRLQVFNGRFDGGCGFGLVEMGVFSLHVVSLSIGLPYFGYSAAGCNQVPPTYRIA